VRSVGQQGASVDEGRGCRYSLSDREAGSGGTRSQVLREELRIGLNHVFKTINNLGYLV
jgi:hypothetical protein